MDEKMVPDELTAALKHEDESVRFNAAVELAHLQQEIALPELIRALGHESWVIRHYHAHHAIQRLGSKAVSELRDTIEKKGREQACAAHTLYRVDPTEVDVVVNALMLALRASELEVRGDSVHALRKIGAPARAAAPALKSLLLDPEESMSRRSEAACALMEMEAFDSELLPVLLVLLHCNDWSVRSRVCGVLMDLGETAHSIVPDLQTLLLDTAALIGTRVDAAQLLSTLLPVSQQSVAVLINALQDTDWWVRLYAARALAVVGAAAASATPMLATALLDADPNVCRNAAYALAEMGEAASEAMPALIQALERDEIAGIAAETLARIGGPALQSIIVALHAGSETVQRMTAYALGKMDTPAASESVDTWKRESGLNPFAPSYADLFLPSPEITLDSARIQFFETLLQEALAHGYGSFVDYRCPYPKYEFLAYMVQEKGCLLHGSNRHDIVVMNPTRRSLEAENGNPLGNINGVYATPDAIWPLFFAIVDRIHHNVWLINGPVHGSDASGVEKAFYHFSINVECLRERPYADGTIYILPGTTFENAGGAERASRSPVRPLVKLMVTPDDFPLLAGMRGFDSRCAGWLSLEEPFVFLDEVRKYPIRALHSA